MTAQLAEHVLTRAVAFGAAGSVALAVHLVALRWVALDLVPTTARPRVLWWRRHTRPMLVAVAVSTGCALAALLLLRTLG